MKALLVVAVLAAPALAHAQSYEIAPPAAPRPSWPDGLEGTAGLSTGGLGSNAVSGVLGGLHLAAGISFGALRLGAEYDLLGLAGSAPAEDSIEGVTGRVSRVGLTAHLRRM